MKKWIVGSILILCAVVLMIAVGVLVFKGGLLPQGSSGTAAADQEQAVTEIDDTAIYCKISDDQELLEKYEEYNADVVGLIRIPNTVLNHPVVQTPKDEEYYLMRGLDKKYNPHGVPFLSARSSMEGKGGNRVIYGHNIHKKTRDIFCDLAGYEDLAFYKEHPIVETVSKSGTRRWLIFAYYLVDNADEEPFKYSDTVDFLSKAAFTEYMNEVEARNWLNVPYDRTVTDTYLTLSSCSNELAGSGTNRMVVVAVEIPYWKDVSSIVADTSMREAPKLPGKLSE